MKGEVLSYDATQGGLISGDDGVRYLFSSSAIADRATAIKAGAKVDFSIDGNVAHSIYPLKNPTSEKSRLVAALLALFLGGLGVHKFYLGYNKAGLIMLIVTIVGVFLAALPTLVIALIAFIEFVIYLLKSDDEFERIYVQGEKQWF